VFIHGLQPSQRNHRRL